MDSLHTVRARDLTGQHYTGQGQCDTGQGQTWHCWHTANWRWSESFDTPHNTI